MQKADSQKFSKDIRMAMLELSEKTLFPWIFDLLLDWSIIIGTLIIAARLHSIPCYVLSIFVIGNRQHAIAVLAHEGVHFALHKNRQVNDLLANLFCFWPLLIAIDGYRGLHINHHSNTGTADDPELKHKGARAPQWDLPLKKTKVALYLFKDIFGYSLPDLFIVLTFSAPKNKFLLVPVVLMHGCFLTTSIMLGFWWIPVLWYSSIATSFMMFFRCRLWLEHQGEIETQRIQLNRIQAAIFSPHKIWLHWEHHKFPTVPYHKLEVARELLTGPEPITLSQLIQNLSEANTFASGSPTAAYRR